MIAFILSVLMAATVAGAQPSPRADDPFSLFLSPMGEPFRGQASRAAGLQAWFAQVDRDKNGWLSVEELNDDATRFFAVLDSVPDGEIDPEEVMAYEGKIAPEIRLMGAMAESFGEGGYREQSGRTPSGRRPERDEFGGALGGSARTLRGQQGGLKGAGRFGLLNIPEPVSSADSNLNRGVSLPEFQKAATARFVLLDTNGDGKLTLDELEARLPAPRRQ